LLGVTVFQHHTGQLLIEQWLERRRPGKIVFAQGREEYSPAGLHRQNLAKTTDERSQLNPKNRNSEPL
jgi:hypothetical protein